ncbi:helix-turn-helix domain-containing protein [Mucilaginibacter aquatilis]|uniref:Helix-turn-helix domain-containing protein n=1 Tax=Mucilaginibacter aquatilis TaxID=1517760 RepID=A0A6I4IFQ5_9SPHI|nr:helix-turn-helix transcriptional regulator [Mucilaginibacter aquatilis]MVN92478.1 helix-turn-helix domain-containing protein [Mucilaginibacter aquatilis]
MNLQQKIISARKKQGLTQEQLADLCKVTVRTIQRIECGDSTPRSYTLNALATALNIPFEEFAQPATTPTHEQTLQAPDDAAESMNFLKMLCLSCFSYLVIPYIHFLIPAYLLRQQQVQNKQVKNLARKIIRQQVFYIVLTSGLLLVTLAYNLAQAALHHKGYIISYLAVFFILYGANAVLIVSNYINVQKLKNA